MFGVYVRAYVGLQLPAVDRFVFKYYDSDNVYLVSNNVYPVANGSFACSLYFNQCSEIAVRESCWKLAVRHGENGQPL